MAPLKRLLQLLWAAGAAGAAFLAATQDASVVQFVAANPYAVWLVGPLFASLSGVSFKEGLCYGKPEAALLFGATPVLMLSHLSGAVSEDGQRTMLGVFAVLFSVFAARKYTQPLHEDLGDLSIFQFLAMSEQQQAERLAALSLARGGGSGGSGGGVGGGGSSDEEM